MCVCSDGPQILFSDVNDVPSQHCDGEFCFIAFQLLSVKRCDFLFQL